ncbi:hypothetical protein W97_07879 [Coniosporium apollinis CBS 100218]|uniref:Pyruvate carboxylase n=1 Tax=Coniosporium apollinis (strain CBS 100218) TaxID=1168221 RepID=R7Z3Z8_CONA1|nr:uncharacterized protein W97_07879 [Coniosporium apollinis CBS 100218]EON68621.1 hypothetical protein W97_07879 [Coniosporium apollinis CBS 100218]
MTGRPPPRRIQRLLVANRGEIAARILSTARELNIETYASYTSGDDLHTRNAAHAVQLSSPASYMNIAELIGVAKKHGVDAVHPGYGFLSESPEFARRMWDEAGVVVIGPGWEILEATGDKLRAKALAVACEVPVLAALQVPTNDVEKVRTFAAENGYPIMLKAVDGGGGRGIRLVRNESELEPMFRRAVEESPSRQLFAERAAVEGFRHIEVQIVGDGRDVRHLWERECSIQRRYQKIVEQAPSSVADRELVGMVIAAALRMAKKINYFSLGTFEFLVNPSTREFYFLEINPRIQVEHTVTESICTSASDLVKVQLLLAQGLPAGLPSMPQSPETQPTQSSLQLRLTAENVQGDWFLSIGKVTSFQLPVGNGIRVDTHLVNAHPAVVSADFDSLIAKIVITAPAWDDVIRKARRALDDTSVSGVKTNIDVLRAIVAHPDFAKGGCDTRWLEANHVSLLKSGEAISAALRKSVNLSSSPLTSTTSPAALSQTAPLLRPGDAWSVTLSAPSAQGPVQSHLELKRVLRNNFPASLSAEVAYTSSSGKPQPYKLELSSTSASSSALTSGHRRGSPNNPSHIIIPFSGKLVEVCIDEGDVLKPGDVVAVVQQMKMELEVRTSQGGKVGWVCEIEDGEDVAEGVLIAIVEEAEEPSAGKARL